MNIWTLWLDALGNALAFLSTDLALGAGVAVIALTLVMRTVLLPITWSIGYRTAIRQRQLAQLRPELERLGMFQALRDGTGLAARFLWVANLARPDVLLAVIAGLTTALMMNANPDLPERCQHL